MLILGRRAGDSILIEGGIRIVVLSCDRGGVRIGIEAPPELKILRGEIAQQVATENQRASASPAANAWIESLTVPLGNADEKAGVKTSVKADVKDSVKTSVKTDVKADA